MNRSNDKKIASISIAVILSIAILPSISSAYAFPPEKELCIALDASGSITQANWDGIIVPGVIAAFENQDVKDGLEQKMVRVSIIVYSTDASLDFGPVDVDGTNVDDLAQDIDNANLQFIGGATDIAEALLLCEDQFAYFQGAEQVIDIVTDGKPTIDANGNYDQQNCDDGVNTPFQTPCDTIALNAGNTVRGFGVDTINVLAIGDQVSPEFNDALVFAGGTVFTSETIDDFEEAFIAKLKIETTQTPVGGLILPIDNYSLAIAGLSANAIWIIPAIAAVAGTFFAIVRFQVAKKN